MPLRFFSDECNPQNLRRVKVGRDFELWAKSVRSCLDDGLAPHQIGWVEDDSDSDYVVRDTQKITMPRTFVSAAAKAMYHRSSEKWDLLYRLSWRLYKEDRFLMNNLVDDDVLKLDKFYRSVGRDSHKMKAFVRFKEVGDNKFVAWHRPDHFTVNLVAPFFAKRFSTMQWTIFTPDESASWDGETLSFGEGVSVPDESWQDDLDQLWKSYYTKIFNPARIKIKAMKKEMPVRYWATMPETTMIESMLADAPKRVEEMLKWQPPSSSALASEAKTYQELREKASQCQLCPMAKCATQTVFGSGPLDAKIVFIGEQPGDEEDLAGKPFVGPAGKVFAQALKEAGLDDSDVYKTNAVKHFKWKPDSEDKPVKRRLHVRPDAKEIATCKGWLEAEFKFLKPKVVVCLGASAAQSVLGRVISVNAALNKKHRSSFCENTLVTYHPSAVLRNETQSKEIFDALVNAMKQARSYAELIEAAGRE